MSVRENIIAPSIRKFVSNIGFLKRREIDDFAQDEIARFKIITPSISQKVMNLSGGNQQKCLVAMWMAIQPEVIIFDEPTRGVDVGARAEIYQQLRDFAASGTGIIMISSDLTERIGMCDRILVFHEGRVAGEQEREDFSEEAIMRLATATSASTEPVS